MLSLNVDTAQLERLIGDAVEKKLADLNGGQNQMSTPSGKLCYSLEDAAIKLGYSPKHGHIVRDMWSRKEIETIKVGRRRCVEHDVLMTYIEGQRETSRD